jgi:hypothetical protein
MSKTKSGILDQFQKELNPKLWSSIDGEPVMNPDFRSAVQQVAESFVRKHGFTLRGQLFYGGNAGYQYGPNSDGDFSVYVDWDNHPEKKVDFENLAKELKADFIDYKGVECHFFLKSPEETELVEANENVYNVTENKWIQKPTRYDFDPKDELSDQIAKAQDFKNRMQMVFDKHWDEIKEMSELGVDEIPKEALHVFKPLIAIVKQMRTNRDLEHKKIREKAIRGEEVTFFDRATQNEIAWKSIDSTPMLKMLDEIKRLLK